MQSDGCQRDDISLVSSSTKNTIRPIFIMTLLSNHIYSLCCTIFLNCLINIWFLIGGDEK